MGTQSVLIDMKGQRFGKLLVIEKSYTLKKRVYWLCLCDCGNVKSIQGINLRSGNVKSCGCGRRKDIKNKRFGLLVAISFAHIKNHNCFWNCKCDCGNETIASIKSLTEGRKISCGCKEGSKTHGACYTPLYQKYMGMLKRCNNKKDKNYGGRGITVCAEWKENFLIFSKWAHESGYKEGLTIERIDVNGDYCPENCTWIPFNEQCNNKSNSRYFTYKGETKTVKQWAAELGFCEKTLRERLRKWTIEEALTTPKYKWRKSNES